MPSEQSWDYGVVAFIDVLGFSAFIDEDSKLSTPKHLSRVIKSLQRMQERSVATGVDVRAFSDSIILSAALSLNNVAEVVEAAAQLQRLFLGDQVLVRGAIAFGKHFAAPGVMYSQALVSAYRLERDSARFPRVIVDKNLLDWFFNHVELAPPERSRVEGLLLRDRDGWALINYLTQEMWVDHANLIKGFDTARVSASVLEKLQWLAAYHNHLTSSDPASGIGDALVVAFRPFSIG